MGYVVRESVIDAAFIRAGRWEVEIAGERCAAEASLAPFYDPKRERVRM
jgi:4-methylaminobutanoate oxidase (formaldehyde-forming)